ncbi:nucleotidyltransferase family protein [Chitinibacteraceae bacterium HSL-7]
MTELDWQVRIEAWLRADTLRWQALQAAASLGLADWALAAGFVRNLVWDQLHGYGQPTPLMDIDLIYFDAQCIGPERERRYEEQLTELCWMPWSVRNQARMHIRSQDRPYSGLADAMRHWVAEEDAVAVRLNADGSLGWIAPFGLDRLAELYVTLNVSRAKPDDFERRLAEKQWLQCWPRLCIREGVQ